MLMDFLSSRLFWGAIVVLIGVSIILNAVFKINIPLFRIIVALLLIYFGVTLLINGFKGTQGNFGSNASAVFSNSNIKADATSLGGEYSVVFGNQTLDLTAITDGADKTVELSTVFGSQKVYVNATTKIRIKATSAFGSVHLPDNTDVSFGDYTYNQQPENTLSAGVLYINASAVFGSIKIYKQPPNQNVQ